MADIFVSYTSSDRDWAFWLGQELEKLGHAPHIHEWEISAGGNIAAWMDERHNCADHILCLISSAYLTKDYSSWERQAAQWAAASKRPNFALPVFIQDCEAPTLLAPFKRCDLYGLGEEDARATIAAYLAPAAKPAGPVRFPGQAGAPKTPPAPIEKVAFFAPPFELPSRQPRNLPSASLGSMFVGREERLDALRATLVTTKKAAVKGVALHGLGGVGKTRLAIEYALRNEGDYSALLFLRADDPAALDTNLAALVAGNVLNLAEKEAPQDAVKIEAVLRWLEAHPTWLMILDSVDDEEAVAAVNTLMARLKGGHVIVTARASNFPASLRNLELDVLDENAGTEFLLERTRDDRTPAGDDGQKARAIARELDGLALGLEQAGAYIAAERIGFARYLTLWRESRGHVVDRFHRTRMGDDKSLAATWKTSVDRLSSESRRLLDRLAMLAPDPIPNSLLDVAVPGETADYSALKALAGLYAHSLVARAAGEHGSAKGFVMHRLVQDFARRAMTEERRDEALREALRWIDDAFVGNPHDVRSWPVLDPLAPHALAVARRADEAGITAPTGRLFNELALLSKRKARYAEAEPLYRRALAIGEATLGPDDPELAKRLNNLAVLLNETNRNGEAEPLHRRALAIWEKSLGTDHPQVAVGLNNLANLLRTTDHLGQAEPLYRRALAIHEASYGSDHPEVATDLNNLALLFQDTNRRGEAERLYRRALAIDEASNGPDHPGVARDLNNLADLLQATNRLAEAEPLFRRALAIFDKSYGADHPNTVMVRKNLAMLEARPNRRP